MNFTWHQLIYEQILIQGLRNIFKMIPGKPLAGFSVVTVADSL